MKGPGDVGSEDRGVKSGAPDYRPLASGELSDTVSLREFFSALGPVMRLPPKEGEPPEQVPLKRVVSSRRPVVLVALSAILLAGWALGPLLLRFLHPPQPAPAELYGIWTTAAPRYRERSFEISETNLRLDLGGTQVSYSIANARRRTSSTLDNYSISYRDGETLLEFAFSLTADSVARIRNLPDVEWKRSR